ncbi:MAG TPA: glycosyl hydrolase [Bacteroidota bacterium]|nr:glycosyl hydrolase [Bacteroidota bacterium]
MKSLLAVLAVILVLHAPYGVAQKKKGDGTASSDTGASVFNGLKFRSIGPAVTSGRVIDFAVNPDDRSQYYAAAASGGVWKTTNAGTTWTPVFDDQASYSIGCIAMDPRNPSVIWVGSGENNSQRSVSYGDGVYRSEDGGKSWQNMGLKASEHIGKIVIDPRNSNVVYAAAQGPLWAPGGDRGLYKTTDGGKTWNAILTISKYTGVSELAMDPRNPDVVYAASYQRGRRVWTLIDGGPESAIHKSTDGGATWKKLTSGLPKDNVGRIGLAISPVNPDVLYAVIELPNRKGGFYRSADRGATWEKRSDYASGSPQYYNEIIPDPKEVDRVYSMDTFLKVTVDGGKTFRNLGEKSKHVDNHAIWIDPDNTNYYLVGSDGGVYESFDRGTTWVFKSNLPITQFYRVAVDNASPFYNVYGGTQDNNTLGGPSRTISASGITNPDWFVTTGGDGFYSQIDPEDPNIVYSESQYGGLVRFDRRSGENAGIKPQEGKGEAAYRWNWDSPLLISPHSSTRLYFAANILFRSDDRGNSWKAVSGDLTRALDRNKLPVMDKIWGVDAVAKNSSTSVYGNITALSESPLKEGLIYVGTDDGLVQVSEDGGGRWRRIERFPDVPETTYVSRIVASQHSVNTVFAAFDNHKNGDFKPYILKSTDAGKSWTSLKGVLPPNGPVYAIAEDHLKADLLFVGTEFGVHASTNGGHRWLPLKGGLPTIAVRDIAIQKRENDLVLGTFGRGFYILDDYTPLRNASSEALAQESQLFPVKDALMFIPSRPYGGRGKSSQGEAFYTADNPPFGATFTYYLRETIKTRKEIRQDAEKEALKKGETPRYPSFDELRVEDEEEAPAIILTVWDDAGNIVRRLTGPVAKGFTRVSWNLRYAALTPASMAGPAGPDEADPSAEGEQGPLALPGRYKITLAKRVGGVVTELAGPQTFSATALGAATLPAADRNALVEFQRRVADLQRAVLGASRVADELKNRIALIRKALHDTPTAPAQLWADVLNIEAKLNDIVRAMHGDRTLRNRNEGTPPSIAERVNGIVDDLWHSTSAPTQTQLRAYEIAGEEFTPQLANLKAVIGDDLKRIEAAMENAGAPWTPGRVPEWKGK